MLFQYIKKEAFEWIPYIKSCDGCLKFPHNYFCFFLVFERMFVIAIEN